MHHLSGAIAFHIDDIPLKPPTTELMTLFGRNCVGWAYGKTTLLLEEQPWWSKIIFMSFYCN